MTDTATSEVAPVTSPETLAKVKPYEGIFLTLKAQAEKANALSTTYQNATKGQAGILDNLLTSSEDEKIVQWRTWDSQIAAKIAELTAKQSEGKASVKAHAQTLVPSLTEIDLDATKSALLTERSVITQVSKALKALLGHDEVAYKAGIELYGITEIIGVSKSSITVGASGIIRKRIAGATIDGASAADEKGKVSFTTLATALDVKGEVIRDAAAKAGNVDSVKDLPNGTTVSFTIVSGDKTHTVTITTPDDVPEVEVTAAE